MRLAASQMAWPAEDMARACALLRRHTFSGVEVMPTKCWPGWQGATPGNARALRNRLGSEGMTVPAMQSITYGVPGLHLFAGDRARTALRDHLLKVADLAQELGAAVMVLGAPALRDPGLLGPDEAFRLAVSFFRDVAPEMQARQTSLCLENVTAAYGCRFVATAAEAVRLVGTVATPGFSLHVDAAGMVGAGEDASILEGFGRFCRHFHASEPGLAALPLVVPHQAMADALAAAGYAGWVSLEMAEPAGGLGSLEPSLAAVASSYGRKPTR